MGTRSCDMHAVVESLERRRLLSSTLPRPDHIIIVVEENKGHSEDLPTAGSLVTKSGEYARKHNPASDFTDVPASSNLPFSAFPGSDFTKLLTVSMLIPNQVHDMHSGSVRAADSWLKSNLGAY